MTAAADTMLAERDAATSAAPPGKGIAREATSFGEALAQAWQDYCAAVEAKLPEGLTLRQVHALKAVKAHPSASQTEIVAFTGIDRSTLADIARRLLRKKFIERRRTKHDARAYAVKLTPEGTRALAAAMKVIGKLEPTLRPALLSTLQQA